MLPQRCRLRGAVSDVLSQTCGLRDAVSETRSQSRGLRDAVSETRSQRRGLRDARPGWRPSARACAPDRLALRRRALLRQRTVVFLDRLAESFGHLIGARERQRIAGRVGFASQRELELLQLLNCRGLKLLQPLGIGVDAIVVERAQVAQHLVEIARADAGLLQLPPETFGIVGPFAELT